MVEEIRVAEFGGTPWEQAIYQTAALTSNNGRNPERVVARQLSGDLRALGIDHTIRYGFAPFNSPSESNICPNHSAVDPSVVSDPDPSDPSRPNGAEPTGHGQSSLPYFKDYLANQAPYVAQDSNILITNADGGGCGNIRGKACVGPGGNIDSDPGEWIHSGPTRWHRNVSGCLHEIGHNMGFFHNPHPGWGDNRDGVWHRTPNNSANGVDNLCGERIPTRRHNAVVAHLWLNECVKHHIHIKSKPPLEQENECPPGTYPDGDGNCVEVDNCPPGYQQDENGVCVPVENGNGNGGIGTTEMVVGGLLLALFFLGRPEGR